jgi:hypothetical protein
LEAILHIYTIYFAAHLNTNKAIALYPRFGIHTARSTGVFPLMAKTVEPAGTGYMKNSIANPVQGAGPVLL